MAVSGAGRRRFERAQKLAVSQRRQRGMHIGIGRVLHHQVIGLQHAEFFDPARGDAEFVRINKQVRLEFVDDPVQRPRFRQIHLYVIAVDVDSAVRGTAKMVRAIGI